MFAPDRVSVPVPDLVRAPVPLMMPLIVKLAPLATLTVEFAPSVTLPDRLEVPVLVAMVPPLSVIASAPTLTPCRFKVAPLLTVVPPAVVPSPFVLVMASVPVLTVVVPL